MIKIGKVMICDRCGVSIFLEESLRYGKESVYDNEPKGWAFRYNSLLCPHCSSVLDSMAKQFIDTPPGGDSGEV